MSLAYSPNPSGTSGGITDGLRVRGFDAGVFNPLGIGVMSEWFDIGAVVGLANGDPAGAWAGRKGLYTLTSAGTVRPTYATNDGDGKAALQFDGVNDYLNASISNAALFGATGDFEIWMRVKISALQGTLYGLLSSAGSTNNINVFGNSSSVHFTAPTASQEVVGSAALYDGAWHTLRLARYGARRLIHLDGTALYDATTTAGTYATGADALYLGTWNGAYTLGSFRHVMFFTAALDDPTAAVLTSYLAAS